MRLSTKGKYALIAMAYIARKELNSKVSVSEVARKLEISQTYLEQLFMKLRKASLVKASRGASGGFSLNHHPKNIRIHDIMEAVDENFAVVSRENGFGSKVLQEPFERVLTEKFWEQFSSQVYLFLHNISLDDVASDSMEPCQAVINFEKV
ncbi:Rrf2 family transcriptional regulator [Paracoccaceae bacterium]|nr:Rrf2 family transcriptional regulator [Paracoccaceae bacterium]